MQLYIKEKEGLTPLFPYLKTENEVIPLFIESYSLRKNILDLDRIMLENLGETVQSFMYAVYG